MTKVKLFRCEGCGDWIPEEEVLTYHGTLAHEYPHGEDGEPMPCGEVKLVKEVDDSQEKRADL